VEPSPNFASLPIRVKYISREPLCWVQTLAVYFVGDLRRTIQADLRCLYCERRFKERQEMNVHYLTTHEEAFTEEELCVARSQKADLEQKLKRSPLAQDN
jgi:hypothetical protein